METSPFTIEAVENVAARFPGAPKLQSFAWAEWDGKWILIAGRTSGYHGVGAADADFPRAGSNDKIWVIDPGTAGMAKTYSFPVAQLPASLGPVKDQWLSSNVLFFQDKTTLYLAGGYGVNSEGKLLTYSVLSSVDLPSLVEGGKADGKDQHQPPRIWTEETQSLRQARHWSYPVAPASWP
jgi:hypothetical protein